MTLVIGLWCVLKSSLFGLTLILALLFAVLDLRKMQLQCIILNKLLNKLMVKSFNNFSILGLYVTEKI